MRWGFSEILTQQKIKKMASTVMANEDSDAGDDSDESEMSLRSRASDASTTNR